MTPRAWLARVSLGVALGALFAVCSLHLAAMVPRTYTPGEEVESLPPYTANVPVRVSFIETAEASRLAFRLVQGAGFGPRRVVFRAVLIEHPEGNLLFSTGATNAPARFVSNPFGALTPLASLSEELADVEIDAVYLPTLRWYHLGAAADFESARLFATSSERWAATDGSMPRRYAIDPVLAAPIAERADAIRMQQEPLFGRNGVADVFGDGTVLVGQLRGSSFDEAAMVVTLGSGRRLVLVADAVWLQEQVTELRPRTPWSVWFFDRNRLRLPSNQRMLHALDQLDQVDVIALLDGALPLPRYPEFWE